MKKFIVSILCLCLVFPLAACGNNGGADSGTNNSEPVINGDNNSSNSSNKATFENDTLTTKEAVFKLTGSELGTDFEGNPMLIVFFDYTNNSEEAKDIQMAWLDCFNAEQNTGATTERLNMGIPDMDFQYQELADMLSKKANPGSTVSAIYYYEVSDASFPVDLKISEGMFGKEIATKTYTF